MLLALIGCFAALVSFECVSIFIEYGKRRPDSMLGWDDSVWITGGVLLFGQRKRGILFFDMDRWGMLCDGIVS